VMMLPFIASIFAQSPKKPKSLILNNMVSVLPH
jgi:hypothetical protein